MSRSRFLTVFLFIVGLFIGFLLSMESGAAQAAPIPNEGTFQLVGRYGGAFSKMHVVNDSIIMVEGNSRIVIYSAAGYSDNDRQWRAKSPDLGHISDLTAVPDGTAVKIYTVSTTTEGSTISAWTYETGSLQLALTTPANGIISVQATGEFLYGLSTKSLVKMTSNLMKISRLDIARINVYWADKPAINGSHAYVATDLGIAIVNTDTMELTELWQIRGVSQIVVDAEGKNLAVRAQAGSGALYNDDYIVYDLQTRVRKFRTWDGETITFDDLPRTKASLYNGRLMVASGYERLRIWDIESGTQINGIPNVVTSMSYPCEAVQVDNRLYIVDAFEGVFIKEYRADMVSQEGGSLHENLLIPSMSDVAQVRQAGRFLVTVGTRGVVVYDTTTDRITSESYWIGWNWGEVDMKDASISITRPTASYFELIIGQYRLVRCRLQDDGNLQYVSAYNWLGDTFVTTSEPDLLATITTDDQPAVITLVDPSSGVIYDVVTPSSKSGLDISSDGKWVYALTSSADGNDLWAYEVMGKHLLYRWRWSGNASSITAHQGTIWYTDGSVGRINNEGDMWSRQVRIPHGWTGYMSPIFPVNPVLAIVGDRVERTLRLVNLEPDNSFTVGEGILLPDYVESISQGSDGLLVGMSTGGIAEVSLSDIPSKVYLPLVAR